MGKVKISNDVIVKAAWVIVPIVLMVILFIIYRQYLFNNRFINKVLLQKDMEFDFFTYDEFDSPLSKIDEENGLDFYYRNNKKYITNSGKDNMSTDSIQRFDAARKDIEENWNKNNPNDKIYFVVNSGYRSDGRNDEVGGVKDSAHRNKEGNKSHAGDISWSKYNNSQKIAIEIALRKAGFNRIGKANSFIHADNDSTLPQNATWYYKGYLGIKKVYK